MSTSVHPCERERERENERARERARERKGGEEGGGERKCVCVLGNNVNGRMHLHTVAHTHAQKPAYAQAHLRSSSARWSSWSSKPYFRNQWRYAPEAAILSHLSNINSMCAMCPVLRACARAHASHARARDVTRVHACIHT
jgi:hypothetical protein